MKKLLLPAGLLLLAMAFPLSAQNTAAPAFRLLQVTPRNLSRLADPAALKNTDAISLEVPGAALQGNAQARQGLDAWVRQGRVLFLHTDAARLFGYRTVQARAGTARLGGQLYGRARAALPFGAHPLLWGSATPARRGPVSLGVRTVYYQLEPGDHLVTAHDAGVPLLEVTDLALADPPTLYAAAIAPWGRGWAMVAPRIVEQHRGDGAAFVRNLVQLVTSTVAIAGLSNPLSAPPLEFIPAPAAPVAAAGAAAAAAGEAEDEPAPVAPAAPVAAPPPAAAGAPAGAPAAGQRTAEQGAALCGIPASLLRRAGAALRGQGNTTEMQAVAEALVRHLIPPPASAPPLDLNAATAGTGGTAAVGGAVTATTGTAAPGTTAAGVAEAAEPALILTWDEADSLVRALRAAGAQPALRPAAAGLVFTLHARLELQTGEIDRMAEWLRLADEVRPRAAEPALVRGILAAGRAEDRRLGSREKGALLRQAAEYWQAAATLSPVLGGPATGARAVAGIPLTELRAWATGAAQAGALYSVESPLTLAVGGGAYPVLVRHFPDDPTLRLAAPSGDLIGRSISLLGWRAGDDEEILIFPTEDYYGAYRQASGLGAANYNNGEYADLVGNRILLLSRPTLPVILPPATPGGARRVVQMGTAIVPVIARLHARALINAVAGGGTRLPRWMELGLVELTGAAVLGELGSGGPDNTLLRQYAAAGNLLGAGAFSGGGNAPSGVAENQAMSLMQFFYVRFGSGAVMETLQRLGARETVDEALQATTGMGEEQFFRAWYQAAFNPTR